MTTVSRAEYLKKYMSDNSDTKPKKRRKKPHSVVPTKKIVKSRIVDDNIDFASTLNEEIDPYADEEVPTVAEILDERPEHIKVLERYRNEKWKQLNDDHDQSERGERTDSDDSPVRRNRYDSDSECESEKSIRIHKRLDSDSDNSLPHHKNIRNDSDQSPKRTNHSKMQCSDSDQSPLRTKSSFTLNRRTDSTSKPEGNHSERQGSDSDQSPPRTKSTLSNRRSKNSDTDQSPKRMKHGSDSDLSPVRRGGKSNSDQSPVRTSTVKTSRGAKAGLSSAAEMREEMNKLRKKEEKAFRAMDKSTTGEHAATVIRHKSGQIVDMHVEMEKERKKKEKDENYAKWSKGLKQQEIQSSMTNDALHEMSKPLARYEGDRDLDAALKGQDREGDPMLAFMKSKKVTKDKKGRQIPKYSGPLPPPNRFGIAPGYRWDGVDRYNGYEKKFFEQVNVKKAHSEAAFKWSIEDM